MALDSVYQDIVWAGVYHKQVWRPAWAEAKCAQPRSGLSVDQKQVRGK